MGEPTTVPAAAAEDLGDFTTTARVLPICALALVIGVVAAFIAAGLLRLIGLFTNLFFFQRIDTTLVSPTGNRLGLFVLLVPVASVLLGVELLLFEWKPRSVIPVALASVAAAAVRRHILGLGPLFPVPPHPAFIGTAGLFGCVVVGLLAGVLSALLTGAVRSGRRSRGPSRAVCRWTVRTGLVPCTAGTTSGCFRSSTRIGGSSGS